jgi:predicted O-methyltransferase YrrM
MIVDEKIEAYLASLPAPTHLGQLEMERIGAERDFPIVGPQVGRLLQQMALAVGARDVFEMGSGFGYSTLFFAHAVGDNGRVVHTEKDPKLSDEAKALLGRAGVAGRVTFEVGDALEVITRYAGPFDVIFIDVDKEAYPAALDLARVRVRPGGFIVTDNVLWSGKVAGEPSGFDTATRAVARYNRIAADAPDLLTTILPLRDGVALHYKLGETPKRIRSSTMTGIPVVPPRGTPSSMPAVRPTPASVATVRNPTPPTGLPAAPRPRSPTPAFGVPRVTPPSTPATPRKDPK